MKWLGLRAVQWIVLIAACIIISNATRSEEDHRWILEQMQRRFYEFRLSNQYGVIYVPPPNSRQQMVYLPTPNWAQIEIRVLYPRIIDGTATRYAHNYATASPDVDGAVYRTMMGRQLQGRNRTIHTEDLLINFVLPRLENWYHERFDRNPRILYLFTHFLPCANCNRYIQEYVTNHTDTQVIVGYNNLYLNREINNPQQRQAAEQRRNSLTTFLRNNGGMLLLLPIVGVCAQRGLLNYRAERSTDSTSTCPAYSRDHAFVITMDFSTGEVVVNFAGMHADYYGWVGLYGSNNERTTYEYTYNKNAGSIKFNGHYITEDRQNVRYFRANTHVPQVVSYKWNNCGMGYKKMTSLPDHYGDIYVQLSANGGYPRVYLKIPNLANLNNWDRIIIQTMDQVGTHNYWTWQYVDRTDPIPGSVDKRSYWFSAPFGSNTANGFRAKYLRYNGFWETYVWDAEDDNVTPFWTPDSCFGTGL